MLQARGVSVFVGGCSAVRNNNVNVRSNLSHWTVSVVKSYSAQVSGVAPRAEAAGGCEKSTARRCEIRAPRSCPPIMILRGEEDDLVEKAALRDSSRAFPTERFELAGIGSDDLMGVEMPYPGSSGTKRLILSFSAGTSCSS